MSASARVKKDQTELLAASLALRDLVSVPHPPARPVLVAARWRVARALLRYLAIVDRAVYARLRCHHNPAARTAATRFAREAEAIYHSFEKHLARWTPEAAEADWAGYRAGLRGQAALVADRLNRENTELLPWLETAPDLPIERAADDRNWAGDGWRFRDLLGVDAFAIRRI